MSQNAEYGVRNMRGGWEPYATPRGTKTLAEATAEAERKNAADQRRRDRFAKKTAQIDSSEVVS